MGRKTLCFGERWKKMGVGGGGIGFVVLFFSSSDEEE